MVQTIVAMVTLTLVSSPISLKDREPNPFAPSLPKLTDEEEAKLDEIVNRFIFYDIGQLKGEEGKKALRDFQSLGPEATFALIRGMYRAAHMESSCPAVVIAKKLDSILRSTTDIELLQFARENIGAGINQSPHMSVIRNLRVTCQLRQTYLIRQKTYLEARLARTPPQQLSVGELISALNFKKNDDRKPYLQELGKRNGELALGALADAAASFETDIRDMGRELLAEYFRRQQPTYIRAKLSDRRPVVREMAAKVAGDKGLPYVVELIRLVGDQDIDVQQAARDALKSLSGGQDFGPERGAAPVNVQRAVQLWTTWWQQQKRR
ncbi:MAG: hypothetical protein KatS3mg105_3386 [Gemmatales bacterium]|nr:MAG: hypothetical protein KatS3mg105_3386 [Gemmatales bacterium]